MSAAPTPEAVTADEPPGDAGRGRELVAQYECRRCHEGTGLAAEPLTRHCVSCHTKVMAGGFDERPKAAEWKQHVAHLSVVPSLHAAGRRFDRGWLVRYLLEPHDLRPALTQAMPRLPLSREQARDIATYLASLGPDERAAQPEASGEGNPERGRAVMDAMQCGSCHRMTGVKPLAAATPLGPEAPTTYQRSAEEKRPAVILAPDLKYTRERMRRERLVAWLLDPAAMKTDTLMPKPGLTPEQAQDVAAYLLGAALEPAPSPAVPAPLPNLDRRVPYEEVAKAVLDVTCRHCHGNPDEAIGDGGPGNTGGFGFRKRGINFTSYEHAQGGYLDDAGKRHSLFEPMPDGTPRLVAALWARHREVAGKPDPTVRGMPLGLPPLPPEQIQLVATWVAQGRPR
ncbi:MAG: c-type cytochrome [Deltaproteobacteria bacterium]|nr:c-type cytochrome [Deltaproteobacteria bacterium]